MLGAGWLRWRCCGACGWHFLPCASAPAPAKHAADGLAAQLARARAAAGFALGRGPWLFWGLGTPYDTIGLVLVVYTYGVARCRSWPSGGACSSPTSRSCWVPAVVRIATDTQQPGHWQLAIIVSILFLATVLMVRTHGNALARGHPPEARTDEAGAPAAGGRPRPTPPPRRRSSQPRENAVQAPPPATTCGSRCTRWACSPGAAPAQPMTSRWPRS